MINIPNLLTLCNLISGSLAIYLSFSQSFEKVLILFSLCLCFDFLDGLAARAFHQTSEIGKQLDSLADLISFGLLPTLLIVQFITQNINLFEEGQFLLTFILVASAGYRLAKFNTIIESKQEFSGMPTPAMAWLVMGWYIVVNTQSNAFLTHPYVVLIMTLVLSLLMNLRIPFLKFSVTPLHSRSTRLSILIILILVISLFFDWTWSVLISGLSYLMVSLLSALLPVVKN